MIPGRLLLLLSITVLFACSEPEQKPQAKQLDITPEILSSIYGVDPGPYSLTISEAELQNDESGTLNLRIAYPEEDGQFPLVIFSHGNWSDNTKYDNVVEHWVSWGYVVVMPYHLDGGGMARGIFNSLRYGQLGLIERRHKDFKLVLDELSQITKQIEPLQDKIDTNKIAATGHSFGAYTAQQMIGATAYDEDEDAWLGARDERIDAVIALSPPGPMFDVITADSWNAVNKPMLLTTGTWDTNPQFFPDWRLHKMSYEKAVPGNNWALVIEGADHYLGNLICRPEREEPPQQDALIMVNAVSLSFLDWHLKDSQDAKNFMESGALNATTGDFARLSFR